ncbi:MULTISPECIES: alkaline phosphatase family protein [Providencia]|uniref:Type I phosphodiesterase / nucleotide pyrophosphatase n=1 Tax=Providencia rustigianii DSM 4541 TaxID=500637 RepID=D1P089_9GAMM|nr:MULTISPECIES: alkaline phosphatase family protein [Providencia]EFB73173.1 type I phosphodiesterase / nucleotide pyrophosphatase [Providencia rustigianii DSM 4541]MTC56112.1 alkaline phosphatase family protein [Providencia rustigianii]SPY76310.1 Type I phosphodiesterase / nucleotide pyrophosphatase [Providencia rustigianii]SUC25491.1 Type I phosphodiesterase / nucleotide pyrophosphatase [Providencia rustigianii]
MSEKVILVVLDGLSYSVAHQCMGYLNGLIKTGSATLYKMECELPSMSRPLYECILTGVPPVKSGIVNNEIVRLSHFDSIFSLAHKAGKITAAAAYYWVSELYNRAPFDANRDRFTHDTQLPIQYGCFYQADHYPDDHLFMDAEYLRTQYSPDFLLIHPMNIDDTGHKFGFDSPQYRNVARKADVTLSHYIPAWMEQGYQIIITSDHGMNNDRSHGGILPEEREIPLFTIGNHFSHQSHAAIEQTAICGTICQLLDVPHPNKTVCDDLLTEVTHG